MIVKVFLHVLWVKTPHNSTLRFSPKERPTMLEEIGLNQSWNKSHLVENSNRPTFTGSNHYLIKG